jgi:hypothetical protein
LKREEASSIKRRELCKNKYKLGSGRSFGLGWVQLTRDEIWRCRQRGAW